MLGTLGDAKTDTLAAQAGANTATLLLQMEQYLAQEPLYIKAEAVANRTAMIAKLQAERDWSFKYVPKAKEYLNLDKAIAYLKTLYYPQDLYGMTTHEISINSIVPNFASKIDNLESLYNQIPKDKNTVKDIEGYIKRISAIPDLTLVLRPDFQTQLGKTIPIPISGWRFRDGELIYIDAVTNIASKGLLVNPQLDRKGRWIYTNTLKQYEREVIGKSWTSFDLLDYQNRVKLDYENVRQVLFEIEGLLPVDYKSSDIYDVQSEHLIVRLKTIKLNISRYLDKSSIPIPISIEYVGTGRSWENISSKELKQAIIREETGDNLYTTELGLKQALIDATSSEQIDRIKAQLALYPGTKVEFNISQFAYGVNHPIFTGAVKDGVTGKLYGDDDLISATLGANTASILLMLNQYESVEGMLPYSLQVQNRQEIERIILDEIAWQKTGVMAPDPGYMYSWHKDIGKYLPFGFSGSYVNHYINEYGREAFTTVNKPYVHPIRLAESTKLQNALTRLKSLQYPTYGQNTPIGDTVKEQIKQQADLFTLSKILPLTKGDFDKILSAMNESDWSVMGLTRLFTHEEYVEMMALAWSDPVYAQEWLNATQSELDRIGYRPTGCKDFKTIMTSGNYSDISYKAAVYECLHPIIFYPQYIYHPAGFMGSVFGKILMMIVVVAVAHFAAFAIAALTAEMGLVAGISTGLSTLAVATINGVIAGAVTSVITQAAFTGEVNLLNVGIAALAAGITAGIGSAFSSPTTISPLDAGIAPPTDVPISVDSGGSFVPVDAPIYDVPVSNFPVETFDIVPPPEVPWYQTTVDLPIVGEVNPTAVLTNKVVSSGLDALKQEANTGQVNPVIIGVNILAGGATAVVVGAGSTIYSNIVDTILNIIGTESSVDTSVANVTIETPIVNMPIETTINTTETFEIVQEDAVPSFDSVPLNTETQETFDIIPDETFDIPDETIIKEEPTDTEQNPEPTDTEQNNPNPNNPIDKILAGMINTGFKGLFSQLLIETPNRLAKSPITNVRAPIGYHYNSSGNIVSEITGQVTPIQDTTVQTQSEISIPWGLLFSLFTAKENKWI
jgi:hypothetical protein